MKRLMGLILGLLLAVTAIAQQRTIKGVVVDAEMNNDPLPRAIVSVVTKDKKSDVSAMTDNEGRFAIKVGADAKQLTVRFIGFKTKTVELAANKNEYLIPMYSDAETVGEVVVTGYQKIDRRKLTASVTTVDISDAKTGAVKNIDQALAGQIAGLSTTVNSGAPGAPVKIRIRGTASINGTQEPLWVLDGIPLEGTEIPSMEDLKDIDNIYQTSIAGINPADIESITVLKDAAATAIYGARAANGVIVITTKKGKEGSPNINFSTKITYEPKRNIDRLNLLDSKEKVDLELALLQSSYDYREGKGGVAKILAELNETSAYKKGGWDALSPNAREQIDHLRAIHTDWNDILFRNTFNQEYYLSLSGGTERADYYTSLGYYDERGNVHGVSNNRMNLSLKTNYAISKTLKVGASVFANRRKQNSYLSDFNGFTNPVYYARLANGYIPPYDSEGNYYYDTNVQGREDSKLDFNIFEERANTSNNRVDHSLMAIFDIELKLPANIKLTSQVGLQEDSYTLDKYAGKTSYAMRKDLLRSTFAYSDGKRSFLPDGGQHKVNEGKTRQWTWKTLAEWMKSFNQAHEIELMAGSELRHVDASTSFNAAYGYDSRTLTTQPVMYPNESMARLFPLHIETKSENAYVSWFATGSYTILHRYTLGGSIRFDGSDVFGVAKKYRYLPLYSYSALWRINREPFMKKAQWLDNLQLRASYGLQGNIDKNTSPYLIGTFDKKEILPGNVQTIISAETAPNPDLRWEKTANINAGLDFGAFNNRVALSIDYYFRNSTDLIGMKMLTLETGFASTTINWASMRNQGVEFALNTINVLGNKFRWNTSLNVGYNTNRIMRETVPENSVYPGREGYPVGALFAYKTQGLDKDGYPLFVGKDGKLQTATEFLKLNRHGASSLSAEEQRSLYTYMGSTDPKYSGGFINTFEYGDWQLSVNFIFNLGMKVRVQPTYSPTNYDRGLNTNRDILQRWTPENTNTAFPKLMWSADRPTEYIQYSEYNLYSMLDIWVKDCNYMRLQSLRLNHTLPKVPLRRVGIKSASISAEVRNLFVISGDYHNYLDPETMANPFAQPIPKSFILGLNLSF